MFKKITVLFLACSFFTQLSAQFNDAGITIKDDIQKVFFDDNSPKRSAQQPKSCNIDTAEMPRYRASALYTISVSKDRSLGQLYSCPTPLTLTGFTFYAFIIPNPPTGKKMNLICNVYKAGPDSLPIGMPLRSDTISIDTTFSGGTLTKIEKHANWPAILLDSNYIITVETDSATLSAGIVTNSYQNGDGQRYNLNCGSISGLWYNGRNLNIGGTPFNADILLHPHVKFNFGTDFTIKSECYNFNDTVRFTNHSNTNMAGSRMYNRYLNFGSFSYEYLCHRWDLGSFNGTQNVVDNKIKYNLKDNYQIRLISTVFGFRGNNGGCVDTTIKQLNYKPDLPGVSGSLNICIGDTLRIKAVSNDPGIVYQWYNAKQPNTVISNTQNFEFGPVLKNDTFIIRTVNNACVSLPRTVIVNATPYPQSLTVQNDSVCAGSKANLKALSDVGSIRWFKQASGGIPFYNGDIYQTNLLNSDTFFFVEALNGQCVMNPRVRVDALVGSSFAPAPPSMSTDTVICLSSSNTMMFSAIAMTGLSVRWFNTASGGSPISTGNNYTYVPNKREVKTFYADAYNGVCGSTRESVTLTVEDFPSVTAAFGDTLCLKDSAHLMVNLPFGDADWYDSPNAGQLIHTGMKYDILPSNSVVYYVQTRSGFCKSFVRTPIDVLVNNFPDFTKLWCDTICAKNTSKLSAVLNGLGDVSWFETDTSSLPIASGLTFTTPVLNGNRKYFASTAYKSCVGPKFEVVSNVKPVPFSGFSFEVLTWQQVRVSPINASGSRVAWDFDDGFKSTLNTVTHRYTDPGVYNIKLVLTSNANQCKDSTIIPVSVTTSSINRNSTLPLINIYPNPGNDVLNVVLNSNTNSGSIEIFNMTGSKVLAVDFENESQKVLDVSSLLNGAYIVKVNGYQAMVFVKQ